MGAMALAASEVLILFNGFLGMSGGDRHLLDMAWHWSDLSGELTQTALPRLAERVLAQEYFDHMQTHFVESPFEQKAVSSTLGVSLCYAWRIVACSLARLAHAPRIVIASGHLLFDVIPALILSRRYHCKWVIYIFHLIQMQERRLSLRNAIARFAENVALYLTRRNAALVITDNALVRDQLVQLGIPADRVCVTPLGIGLDAIHSAPASPKRFQAVFFGRLVEHKGVYDLVDIWERVVAQIPGSKLLIIGDGPARAPLAQHMKDKHLDGNVEFAGLVNPQSRVYELLKQCHLCLHPSHEEGWGISICEAMACGLPVVAYDLPAYGSVFRQGLVKAPLGDKDGLARHLIHLLSDEISRNILGAAAVQQASEYDVAVIAKRQWAWLCNVVS